MSLQPSWVDNTDIFQGGEKKFDYYLQLVYVCVLSITVAVRRRRRSGVLRISSEEMTKKLMYLE